MPEIRSTTRTLAVAIAVAVAIAGCGGEDAGDTRRGEDRLSRDQTAQQINAIFATTSRVVQQSFHSVFAQLDRVPPNDPLPARVRARLEQPVTVVAGALREAADRTDALSPPADAEQAVDALVDSARRQAQQLEQLPGREGLTVGELAGAVQPPAEAMRQLSAAGIKVQPPGGGG